MTPEIGNPFAEPPTNVRLVFAGVEVPVDCTYSGYDPDSYGHIWVAINPRPTVLPDAILVDRMPNDTSITVGGGTDG